MNHLAWRRALQGANSSQPPLELSEGNDGDNCSEAGTNDGGECFHGKHLQWLLKFGLCPIRSCEDIDAVLSISVWDVY